MVRLSKLVVICLRVGLFTAALTALFGVRAAQVERSPAAAEIPSADRNDTDAPGGWQLVGPDAIGEGRSAMNEIFKRRHAVRSFQARNISHQQLGAILAAADSAPSAGGLKSREQLIVTDDATKKRLVEAAHGQEFVAQAPVVIVFWAVPSRSASKYGARGRDLFALQDATIAASFAWLQAVASGLGACWVGAFDDEAVKNIFREKIGPDWRPIALLPVGYAAE
jgi:nitroreductase